MEEKLKQEPSDVVKIVLFGPESTGKTTLSEQLARYYNTVWVPEYAREYLQNKWNNERKTCEPHDLLPIAEGQIKMENELSKKATNILICDTDLLETKVYAEAYYIGDCDPLLEKYAITNSYDLYLLTDIDIPWEADDLRDKPNERKKMFQYFHNTLKQYNRNFIILSGSKEERLKIAIEHIEKLKKPMINFSDQDIAQLKSKGISKDKVLTQIETFKEGIPFVNLEKAAIVDEGISRFSLDEEKKLIEHFENFSEKLSLLKFVPASGAASRMFKAMFNFIESYNPSTESLSDYINRTGDKDVKQFTDGMKNLPFYDLIFNKISERENSKDEVAHSFVKEMLEEEGFNYGFFPKGLLPFHNYNSNSATPFKEHLKEGALYAKAGDSANLHFTISEQHDAMFKEEYKKVGPQISDATNTNFNVSYSNQKPSTDTLAVDMNNEPFRNSDGSILFRPGGHGALIENLNDQDADIIFIKNIDNVVIESNLNAVANSKKVLAGLLLEKQAKAFEYAKLLDAESISTEQLAIISKYLQEELNVRFTKAFETKTDIEKILELKEKINRPIRICGMVKNEGEPGGGPFWIKDGNGNISLQIIESAQIDMSNEHQVSILKNATHFNPVDLVCGIRNYKGEKYNLLDYVDTKQGFITGKTKEGKELKALELPGLWNGAMAYWNTIFVEVPLVTFNPVKTVNDLLKPSHQA
jgi:nicotinamide riboside kinase